MCFVSDAYYLLEDSILDFPLLPYQLNKVKKHVRDFLGCLYFSVRFVDASWMHLDPIWIEFRIILDFFCITFSCIDSVFTFFLSLGWILVAFLVIV